MSQEQHSALDAIFKPKTWDEHIAYWISQLASPPMLALLALVLINTTLALPTIWMWSSVYLVFTLVLPLTYILIQVRKGNITDIDIQLREQRHRPFLLLIAGGILAWFAMILGSAPAVMTTIAGAVLIQSLCIFLITLRWKISVHSATATAISVLVLKVLGPSAAPVAISVPLVAWSRVKLRRHTPAQTFAGVLLGGSVFLAVLLLAPAL
ncbi:MAG: phosphatase PAP2 family protein [Anaerolineae bacterium]|nr:phosphatase PAP2 family protein [Anaerolineae bacterium]